MIVDAEGLEHRGIDTFCKAMFPTAKELPDGTLYVIGTRQVRRMKQVIGTRVLLVLFHPRGKRSVDDLPPGSIKVAADYWAAAFYISDPNPEPHIRWWAWIYSVRWVEENWFKSRSGSFHGGRAHKIERRMLVMMLGILLLALYGLVRVQVFPVLDVSKISRKGNVKQYAEAVLAKLGIG